MTDQLMFPMGTLHVCPKCGVEYRCDEEDCVGQPGSDSVKCPSHSDFYSPHSQWGDHRARRDPVWAAKLARIMARQRSCSQPLQEKSPCDLTRLDEVMS